MGKRILLAGLTGLFAAYPAFAGQSTRHPQLRNVYRPGVKAPHDKPLMHVPSGTHLSADQYRQIRDATLALIDKYPPDQYFYVGVGRSPAPIIAFLENLAVDTRDIAINFPSSQLRSHEPEQFREAYFSYFKKLLPKRVLKGDRKILLVDRAGIYGNQAGGSSVVKLKKILEAFLQEQGSSLKVEGLAYAPHPLKYSELHHIDTRRFPEVDQFGSQNSTQGTAYDEIARYPENDISQRGIAELRENAGYDQFKNKMMERMRADPTLGDFLTKAGALPVEQTE